MGKTSSKKYYAVAKGLKPGIYRTWQKCKVQVHKIASVFGKFLTREEAEDFVKTGTATSLVQCPAAAPATGKRKADSHAVDPLIERSKRAKTKHHAKPDVRKVKSSTGQRKTRASTKTHVETGKAPRTKKKCVDDVRVIEVYTDGAASNNGKPRAKAGWGVYWPEEKLACYAESARLPGELQTSNRAELMGIIRACQIGHEIDAACQLRIHTDSLSCIMAVAKIWQRTWRRVGWMRRKFKYWQDGKPVYVKTATRSVSDRDLVQLLIREMRRFKHRPELVKVKAHSSSRGNQEADRLAVAGAKLSNVPREGTEILEPGASETEEEQRRSSEKDSVTVKGRAARRRKREKERTARRARRRLQREVDSLDKTQSVVSPP